MSATPIDRNAEIDKWKNEVVEAAMRWWTGVAESDRELRYCCARLHQEEVAALTDTNAKE